jgi:hypothetical protein
MRSPIEQYLLDLTRELRARPLLARRVAREVADHLSEAAARAVRTGASREDAERSAVAQMGPPRLIAGKYRRLGPSSAGLLVAASIGTAMISVWLVFVCAVVLPRRDPDHIAMWLVVAALCAAFTATSAACVSFAWRRPAWLVALGVLAITATAFGLLAAIQTLQAMAAGRGFEGYLLLMGVMLTGHGLVAAIYAILTARVRVLRVTMAA